MFDKCKYHDCVNLIESGRSDKEYCSSACRDKDHYEKRKVYERRLNEIKGQIRKNDRVLERLYRLYGSQKMPISVAIKEGFIDGSYCRQIYHAESGNWYKQFLDYVYFINPVDQTIIIHPEYELRTR